MGAFDRNGKMKRNKKKKKNTTFFLCKIFLSAISTISSMSDDRHLLEPMVPIDTPLSGLSAGYEADTNYFTESLSTPVTQFSTDTSSTVSTPTDSSFYDYLLSSNLRSNSNISKQLYEIFKYQNTEFSDSLKEAVPGYTLLSSIANDFYRGFSRTTRRSVLVRYTPYISAGSMSRFFNEWYTLSGKNPDKKQDFPKTLPTNIDGILYPIEFIPLPDNGGYAMIYEDILNMKCLKEMLLLSDKDRLLKLILKVLDVLAIVHKHGFSHNGLTASSILFNDNEEVYITGWDFCFSTAAEDCSRGYRTLNKRFLINYLPYMAPEVSGEVNKFVDYRADLYSLGIILYQITVGSLPFIASDARELINHHIKEVAPHPSTLGVSPELGDIIMKLLSKNASDRYQSCEYLKYDLELTLFGKSDQSVSELKFAPSQNLYGRVEELKFIDNLYQDTKPGVHLVILKGEEGVGKTKLVNEIQSMIVKSKHNYAHWKCNTKTTGFKCFISLMNDILHQILSSSETDIENARDAILETLGSMDLTFIFTYLPELRELLGPNYVKHMSNQVTDEFLVRPELKFRQTLKLLFVSLGRNFPLTLLFDDFQWFSLTDLELLHEVRAEISKLEVSSTIILIASFNSSSGVNLDIFKKKLNGHFIEMEIKPNDYEDIYGWTRETLIPLHRLSFGHSRDHEMTKTSEIEIEAAAKIFFEKSKGNCLLAKLMVINSQFKGIFRFDVDAKPMAKWSIDLDELSKLPDTKEELYAQRLNCFDSEDLELLKYSVVVYDRTNFTLKDLALASNKSVSRAAEFISRAITAGLILPMNIFYKFPFHLEKEDMPFNVNDDDIGDLSGLALYTFFHDSAHDFLQESLFAENEMELLHKAAGLRLYHGIVDADKDVETSMSLAYHFTKSLSVLDNEEEAAIYIKVFEAAQNFCYKIFDFFPALEFFNISRNILEKFGNDKKKLYVLHTEIIRCLLMTKNFQGTIDFIQKHSQSFQNDPKIVLYKMKALSANIGTNAESFQLGLKCINKNGIDFSTDPEWYLPRLRSLKSKVSTSMAALRNQLSTAKAASSKVTILHEIITELILNLIYTGELKVASALAHFLVEHSLEHGLSGFSSLGFIILAIDQMNKSPARAKEYAQFGLGLIKKKSVPLDFINKVFTIYCITIGAFLEPIRDLLKFHELIISSSSQLTSSYHVAFAMKVAIKPLLQLHSGHNCNSIYNAILDSVTEDDLENRTNRLWFKISMSTFRLCLLLPYDPKYDIEKEEKPVNWSEESFYLRSYYYCTKSFSVFFKVDPEAHEPLVNVEIARFREVLPFTLISIWDVMRTSYMKMDNQQLSYELKRQEMLKNIEFVRRCSEYSPDLFESKYLTLKAEMMKLEGSSDIEILDAYIEAIESAKNYNLMTDVAIINERCGEWLAKISKTKTRVIGHVKEAIQYSKSTGYAAMINRIKVRFPEVFEEAKGEALKAPVTRRISEQGGDTNLSPLNFLISSVLEKQRASDATLETIFESRDTDRMEFTNILRAILSISESIHTESILEKLIRTTISILGAEFVVVALLNEHNIIEYKAVGGPNHFKYLETPDSSLSLPENLIQEVVETGSIASNFKEFNLGFKPIIRSDPYFYKFIPKSLLCLPIKNELEVTGAIYFESSKSSQIFDDEKLNVVAMLCTQAAFALDKSRLYYNTMLAKKAAEAATREKATFLANMSHEIRTPFNSLFACAGFLFDTNLDALQREYVETIQSSAQVTLDIVDAILTYSKIEHGSLQLEEKVFSINDCIESAMKLVAEQAAEKGLDLAFFNRAKGCDLIKGDATRFRQVIINLLGNSVKFTQRGSVIMTCSAKKISNDSIYEFVISVKDTGIGIPKNSHSKVFGAFSQVDGSSRRVFGGSGLGLTISKKLVELMGGSLTFESNEGEGTTFYFTLASAVVSSPKEIQLGENEKLVIVHPKGVVLESLKLELESETKFDVEIIDDVSLIDNFEGCKIVFLSVQMYEEFECKITKDMNSHEIVLLNHYGHAIPEKIQKHNHSVILLPFQRAKLKEIISTIMTHQTPLSTPGENEGGISTSLDKPRLKLLTRTPEDILSKELPLKILLVEDNFVNTRVALQHLKKFGYKADSAIHGGEALEKCAELIKSTGKNYDLILMDLQMPVKDGIETSKELIELYGGSHLRPVIVALTANVELEERDRCISCGMTDFISKPIIPDALGKVLRTVGHIRNSS